MPSTSSPTRLKTSVILCFPQATCKTFKQCLARSFHKSKSLARMVNREAEESIKITLSREETRTSSSSLVFKTRTSSSHRIMRSVVAVVVVVAVAVVVVVVAVEVVIKTKKANVSEGITRNQKKGQNK